MILRPCTPKFIWNPWKASPNPPIFRQTHGQGEVDERGPSYQGGETWLTFGNVTNHGTWQCFVMNVSDLQMDRCGSFSLHNSSCHVIFTSFASFFLRTYRRFDVFWWILVVQELPHTCISCGLVGKKDHFVGSNIPMRSPSFSQRKSWFKAHEIPYDCSPFA